MATQTREMFLAGKKEAGKVRVALRLVVSAAEDLASYLEVERWPSCDAAAKVASVRLERAIKNLSKVASARGGES